MTRKTKTPPRNPKRKDTDPKELEAAAPQLERMLHDVETNPSARYGSALSVYLSPFRKFSVPSPAEFGLLFERYECGDEKTRRNARDLLVYSNIRFVVSVALRYTGRGLPLEDLLQEGAIGLMQAIEKFDHRRGSQFSTYAYHWIRQGLVRALKDSSEATPYRIPVHWHNTLHLVRRGFAELYLANGRFPREAEIFHWIRALEIKAAAKISLGDVVRATREIRSGKGTERLDAPAFADEPDAGTVLDRLSPGPPKTETAVEAKRLHAQYLEAKIRIEAEIDTLPPRTASILRLRLGLGDFDPMTTEEVGARYELTKERVRQVEANGLRHLKETLDVEATEIEEILIALDELEKIIHA